ncbi:MAG: DNA-3-methyladenine glycosylase family protein [Steroidobacteraceae bacterium]
MSLRDGERPAPPPPRALSLATLAEGVRALARRDADFAALYRRNGLPPLWARRPGFPTLVHIVLEQQVSIVAARSLFRRVREQLGGMSPERVAERGVLGLHRLGLTRQKASYCHALALAALDGSLSLSSIARGDDSTGRRMLLALRGIGPWSADIYYLMALRRPDVWPTGDLALAVALQEVKRLRARPDAGRQLEISAAWAPWRSVAARLLWHYYLTTPRTRRN